ncbi:MAG: SH3 domain-containing protein [Velocimicrobium sp.]
MVKYKKLKIPLFCIIFLCLFGYIVLNKIQYSNAESPGTIYVTGTLNVREGAGTTYKVVGTLTNGTKVTVLEDAGNGWSKIKYDSITGYVSSQYVVTDVVDETYKQQLITSGFPETYAATLALLHVKYPNWEFIPVKTGLDWNNVITSEIALGKNNVLSSSISSWKSIEKGAYGLADKTWVAMDGAGWVPASKGITQYYMDPRNFLDATSIFQFLNHTYDSSKQNETDLSAMLSGTFLANTYKENDNDVKYSTTLIQAAEKSSVNPYIIASMILVEQGNNGQGNSISGVVEGYEGYFNYFNIGAYATSNMSAVERGLWFAKGLSINETTYNRPWNNVTNSIYGGAIYFGKNYVQAGQNTLYLKKFNVQGSFIYNHQYMTNIQGAETEASKLAKAYTTINNNDISFSIPIYENMPDSAAVKPTGKGEPNNYLKSLTVEGCSLNPVFDVYTQEYTLIINSADSNVNITAEPYETTSTVTGVGDIKLAEGMSIVNITVTAQNGLARTYQLSISKSGGSESGGNGESTEITESTESTESTDSAESTDGADLTDTIGAYTVTNGYLTGVSQMIEVETLLSKMDIADANVKVYQSDKEITSGYVGTGSMIRIRDTSDQVLEEYTILIYGDINGDGKISIADLLKMQKVILGLEQVDGVYSMATDANQDGKTSIADLLKIQKTLLKLKED